QFTTNTSSVVINGFKDFQGSDRPCRFTTERSDPTGITYFDCLHLPPYEGYESLKLKLCFAIES
ncbi:hypothetical protein EDB83DRAFT_2193538, partial [Lactarius deliciosus]